MPQDMDIDEIEKPSVEQLSTTFSNHPFMMDVDKTTYTYSLPMNPNTKPLMQQQIDMVKWLIHRFTHPLYGVYGGIAWVKTGFGKGYASWAAMNLIRKPTDNAVLFAMPLMLVANFIQELKLRIDCSQVNIIVLHRQHNSCIQKFHHYMSTKTYHIVIVPYSTLRILYRAYLEENHPLYQTSRYFYQYKWSTVCFDESHKIGHYKTKTWKACVCVQADRKFCMTGTVVRKNVHDVISQLKLCGLTVVKHPSNWTKEMYIFFNLCRLVFVQNDHPACSLPTLHEYTVHCRPNPVERRLQMILENNAYIQNQKSASTKRSTPHTVFPLLHKLRVLSIAPCLLHPSMSHNTHRKESFVPGDILGKSYTQVEQALTIPNTCTTNQSSKMITLCQIVAKIRKQRPGEKILIFAYWKGAVELACGTLQAIYGQKSGGYMHSELNNRLRDTVIQRLQTDPNYFFLCSTDLLTHGFNLVEANHVILLHPDYTYYSYQQMIGRIRRIHQRKTCHVYTLVATDTFENRVMEIRTNKKLVQQWIADQKSCIDEIHMQYIQLRINQGIFV
jgi:SNF2 family DNA or RNA helicase